MTESFDVVVIGGGKGGSQTVASLRDEGYAGSILLLAAEDALPYDRPPLSKGFLTGAMDTASLALREAAFYGDAGVEVRTGCTVVEVDTARRRVITTQGEVVYGHLVFATGAEIRRLPLDGVDAPNVAGLKDLADAEAIRERLGTARDVVVIGGGFIGLEVAAVASTHFGCRVTLLEALPRIMARTGLPETAAFVRDHHTAELGVDIRVDTAVTALEVDATGHVTGVRTAVGERLPADLVVYGIGVIPRVELAERAGLAVANGIEVDECLRTSAPDVWAVGDCASFPLATTGARLRLESVQNATDQARHVAASIAGAPPAPYRAVPWFWSDQDSLKIQSAGILHPDDHRVVVTGAPGSFSVLAFRQGLLVGGDSVNAPGDHLAIRRLLGGDAARAHISIDQAESADFDLKSAVRSALAEAKAARGSVSV